MANTNGLIVSKYGTKRWYRDGRCHRDDGPAVEYPDGTKFWYHNGLYHRTDGPAVEYPDGLREWWIDGVVYTFSEWIKVSKLSKAEICELVLYYG